MCTVLTRRRLWRRAGAVTLHGGTLVRRGVLVLRLREFRGVGSCVASVGGALLDSVTFCAGSDVLAFKALSLYMK